MLTTSSIRAVNYYLKNEALSQFGFLPGFEYDHTLTFSVETRENIAKFASSFKQKYGHTNWLAIVFNRSNITWFNKKIVPIVGRSIAGTNEVEGFHYRILECTLTYLVVSPSPELLEDVEETMCVVNIAHVVPATVLLNNEPWTYDVNIQECMADSFGITDRLTEGLFSTLSVKAKINYPGLIPISGPNGLKLVHKIICSIYGRLGTEPPIDTLLDEIVCEAPSSSGS